MNGLFDGIFPKNKEKILNLIGSDFLTVNENVNITSFVMQKRSLCYIEYGKIQIIKNAYNGNRIIIDEYKCGDLIENIRNSDLEIITQKPTKILSFDYNELLNISKKKISQADLFQRNVLILMHRIIQKNSYRIEILSQKTIRNKLLHYFSINSNSQTQSFYISSTFSALADYLCVDRCAMTREIKNLKDEGLIKIKGKKITLLYSVNY